MSRNIPPTVLTTLEAETFTAADAAWFRGPITGGQVAMVGAILGFSTWAELLAYTASGGKLLYGAPMDAARRPFRHVMVIKAYRNGKLRIDPMSNQAARFTADASHLGRFRRFA